MDDSERKTLFVSGLSEYTSEHQLKDHFKRIGPIKYAEISEEMIRIRPDGRKGKRKWTHSATVEFEFANMAVYSTKRASIFAF